MKNSNQLNEFTLGQLKEVLKEYPYFQMARILYLKNLYLLQKSDFENELKNSVAYIYNRPFLHDFLFVQDENLSDTAEEQFSTEETDEQNIPIVASEKETKEIITEPIEETKKESLEDSVPEKTEEQKEKEEQQLPTKKDFSSNIKENISGLLNNQIEQAEKETGELEITQVQMDVEKEYGRDLEKVSKKQEDFVLLDDNKLEELEDPNDKKRISNSVSYAKGLLEFDYILRNPIKYNPDSEEADTENKTEKSFTEWLESLNNKTIIKNEETTETTEEPNNENVEKIDTSEIKNQIIENFIKTNPAIRPKDKPFEYEDISTNSVKEDENIMTDTLARIYYNQGRYDKALEAYQKLSLKYPEKNSYFATQIEKIKNKLNDLK